MNYDYLVIGGYFALIMAIGFVFKNMAAKSTSDYFRGGGRMLWWMVGSTAFMMQFSAWTFTGAAGKAFTDGFAVSLVFFANAFSYFCGWAYFAHRFRQMRVDTPTEAIGRRFGDGNELFFSCALIIFTILNAGIWLNALGVFSSAVFEADINLTIVFIGFAVVFISVLAGAWGVVASDFVQTLTVAVVSIACAVVALVKVGGPVNCLMAVGSIIWFIPPWASAILYPDAAAAYPELGNKASDAVYLVFARNAMPVGTVGLLLAGLFAATMSSMDSALNKNSGIFVRSIYQPYLDKRQKSVSDLFLLNISRLLSLVSGILVIALALYFKSLKELSLFDLMMSLSAMIQVPILIPLLLGIFVKHTPKWAPWVTVLLGLFVSWFMLNILTPAVFADWLGIEPFTRREATDMNLILTIGGQVFITGGFFCLTSLLYKKSTDPYVKQREDFFEDLETPIVADFEQDAYDQQQRHKLGAMVTFMGAGLTVMVLIPNPLWGRVTFLLCGLVILTIGQLLRRSAKIAEMETLP